MPIKSSGSSFAYTEKAPFLFLKAERQLEDEHPKSCVALEQVKIPILAI
jgi:hypothetical protein